MKIVAIIPAHLASVRFPNKILFEFHGLPMIEHVRRRALLSKAISDVFVATCDDKIAEAIECFGGKVIRTANTHTNGTSRIAEAIEYIDCTHVILLQGDEPLLLPRHLEAMADSMKQDTSVNAWNATGPIEYEEELDRHSFVKCAVSPNNRIMYCFRRSPAYSEFNNQQKFIRKILGLIAFEKNFLLELTQLPASVVETYEFIEQMRIVENGFHLRSVPVSPSLPSVNEPSEADIVLNYIQSNEEQRDLLLEIMKF
ncbi:cytidylyltransferase domain-containing protein [Aquirufa aurantiipilula]|uniref:NTP transferase domain-containing protein n=1 Tax=Aquirufa aurantiipilula TaxID=2696561 RepID=A0ABT6BKF6_9BACT|nr:NTP transferase domain-containing protein [Aquirufa aurantiipilula]MDF5690844.1 NTP transferase domain-containing protein [Aquirufa aurantiipilula]